MGSSKEGEGEKLVVEVLAAHNLMPKDGQGSSFPFVEVEFEHRKLRTTSKQKDLNPVWNETLVFPVFVPADLPYRSINVSVYNSSPSSRNFLGRVRIPASSVPVDPPSPFPVLLPLEKRSLFSHIRGDITLKLYLTKTTSNNGKNGHQSALATKNGLKNHLQPMKQKLHQHQHQQNQKPQQQQSSSNKSKKQQEKKQQPMPVDVPAAEHAKLPPVVLAAGPPVLLLPEQQHHPADFSLRETRPRLGAADKSASAYDLVEQMQYLYVRVVRARDLPVASAHAEVKLGNYRGITQPSPRLHWDQVFSFSKDSIQSTVLEVLLKDRDEPVACVALDLNEVPRRVPPDSSLAPQWYMAGNNKGEKGKGELMLSAWFGTQADEAFSEAWHSKAAGVHRDGVTSIKAKVYLSPKLWYLRVTLIEAQDLAIMPATTLGRPRPAPELVAKAQVGGQFLRTRAAISPYWNEDLMFVVAEPFADHLAVWVEDRDAPLGGRGAVPLSAVERRAEGRPPPSRWLALGGCRLHVRMCLEGGYHVLDEAAACSSDLRPTEKRLWGPHVGVLEMGILSATGLHPTKVKEGKGPTVDPYCVAKYGGKWVRTRTAIDSPCPRWNEQYTWEVFDPCTILTVGVFDNSRVGSGARDAPIGKVRVRLSALEAGRVYTHAYPIVTLHPAGVRKAGELHLALRFSCGNASNLWGIYLRPLLPKMHYVEPLAVPQLENLRHQAGMVVAASLARAEPPLGREVVDYLLGHGSTLWSMRRSKANFFRLVAVLSGPIAACRWVESIRNWQRPAHSVAAAVTFSVFLVWPELTLPAVLVVMAGVGLWRYRSRPRHPPHLDTRLSQAESVFADELDEEFDTFPTSRPAEVVRMRYDRLRSVAGRVQMVAGDLATQGERLHALLSWRDPRATLLFLMFCIAAVVLFYAVPVRVVVGLWGGYALRPPRFRSRMPSSVMSFFRRLPTRADSFL